MTLPARPHRRLWHLSVQDPDHARERGDDCCGAGGQPPCDDAELPTMMQWSLKRS
jgi:hypothetical protein